EQFLQVRLLAAARGARPPRAAATSATLPTASLIIPRHAYCPFSRVGGIECSKAPARKAKPQPNRPFKEFSLPRPAYRACAPARANFGKELGKTRRQFKHQAAARRPFWQRFMQGSRFR